MSYALFLSLSFFLEGKKSFNVLNKANIWRKKNVSLGEKRETCLYRQLECTGWKGMQYILFLFHIDLLFIQWITFHNSSKIRWVYSFSSWSIFLMSHLGFRSFSGTETLYNCHEAVTERWQVSKVQRDLKRIQGRIRRKSSPYTLYICAYR